MTGKERILAALNVQQPDRVPLYIHGINEGPIIGIGRHLTDGLPEPKQFHDMTDVERLKLLDTLFLIHEHFGVDGFTSFEIGHEVELDKARVLDDWGIMYLRSPHGLPVPKGHPVQEAADLEGYRPPTPKRKDLLMLDLSRERFSPGRRLRTTKLSKRAKAAKGFLRSSGYTNRALKIPSQRFKRRRMRFLKPYPPA